MQINRIHEKEVYNLIDQLKNINRCSDQFTTNKQVIESKLFDIIKNNFSEPLSHDFVNFVDKNFLCGIGSVKCSKCWRLFCNINSYINTNSNDEKTALFKEIDNMVRNTSLEYILDKELAKSIYLCNVPEIVELFKKKFPKPPVSIFDADKIPQSLIKENEEKNRKVTEFKNRNSEDKSLEKKVLYIQRHIRAKNRKKSEIERINFRYFIFEKIPLNEKLDKIDKAMEDANKPYKPQKCNPELADRIMKAADQVTLHSSVKHLTATKNIGTILDGCLLGRENLLNSYTSFRPAALMQCDISDGDGNVICFGPDKIDGLCSGPQTIQLEFDLAKILNPSEYNKNPSIFFKQRDFGYGLDLDQAIDLKTESIIINHTGRLRCGEPGFTNLKLYPASGGFCYSELPKYSFISYNTDNIQKIWTLNFFRFLDTLINSNTSEVDDYQINHIYDLISKLSDKELVEFLTDLGKKMSCTAEFNFYGAYQIDLNALQGISLIDKENFSITISQLCEELNSKNFTSLSKLKTLAPELLKSHRFIEFLLSKISDPNTIQEIKTQLAPLNDT